MRTLLEEIMLQIQFVPGKVKPGQTDYVRIDTDNGHNWFPCNKIMNAIKLAFATGKFEGQSFDIIFRTADDRDVDGSRVLWRQYECRNGKPVLKINEARNYTIYGESVKEIFDAIEKDARNYRYSR